MSLFCALAALLLPGSLFASTVPVTFRFQAGKSSLPGGSLNSSAESELQALIDGASAKEGIVRIRTFSSPEGKTSWNARLAQRRSDSVVALLKEKWPGLPDSLVVVENVAEDWKSVETYVRSVDKPWKEDALTLIRKGGDDLEERLLELWGGVAWDDLLWNCFTRIRRSEIEFIFAPDTQFSARSDLAGSSGPVEFVFPVGCTDWLKGFGNNAASLEQLTRALNQTEGGTVVIDAFASPEGRRSWNLVLARRRAESVRTLLIGAGISPDRITVRTQEENWAGLRSFVSDTYPGADRDEVLAILDDSSMDESQKESALRALSGGRTWNGLIASAMGGLRVVRVSF